MGKRLNDKLGMRMNFGDAKIHRGSRACILGLGIVAAATVFGLLASGGPALAEQAVSCGGAAMAGGAELMCSHVQPTAPSQFCTYSWALMTTTGALDTIQGSFLLPPGASNQPVYQGYGFNSALSNPIVLCQGRKS